MLSLLFDAAGLHQPASLGKAAAGACLSTTPGAERFTAELSVHAVDMTEKQTRRQQ